MKRSSVMHSKRRTCNAEDGAISPLREEKIVEVLTYDREIA